MDRTPLMIVVAENLNSLMKRNGTNAFDLAKRSGVNDTAIYDILKGKSKHPRLDTLQKIAEDGLGLPLWALVSDPAELQTNLDLIEVFGRLSEEDRKRALVMARALLPAQA